MFSPKYNYFFSSSSLAFHIKEEEKYTLNISLFALRCLASLHKIPHAKSYENPAISTEHSLAPRLAVISYLGLTPTKSLNCQNKKCYFRVNSYHKLKTR